MTELETGMLIRHHIIHFQCPRLDLKRSESEIVYLPVPENCSTRYERLPLVPDSAVQEHAYRDSEETAFFSVTPTNVYGDDACAYLAALPLDDLGLYASSVFSLLFRGQIVTRIFTYRTDHNAPRIRIARCTIFVRRGGRHIVHTASYDFEVASLPDEAETTEARSWYQMLLDLVYRRTDRTCLHVRHRLREQRRIEAPHAWRPQRLPRYAVALMAQQDNAQRRHFDDAGQRICPICMDEWLDYAVEKVLTFSCSDHHAFHLECLVRWCQTQDPDRATCPSCRQPIFAEPSLNLLKFSTVGSGFNKDFRYTARENFERSCADLDKELVEHSRAFLTCNKQLIETVFYYSSSSQSRALDSGDPVPATQMVYYTKLVEYTVCRQSLLQFVVEHDGALLPAGVMYRALLGAMDRRCMAKLIGDGLSDIIPAADLAACASGKSKLLRKYTMLPGVHAFLRRLLNRTICFQLFRACSCAGLGRITNTTSRGLNSHPGDGRRYYDPLKYGLPGSREKGAQQSR